jgi:hypothetical protein
LLNAATDPEHGRLKLVDLITAFRQRVTMITGNDDDGIVPP